MDKFIHNSRLKNYGNSIRNYNLRKWKKELDQKNVMIKVLVVEMDANIEDDAAIVTVNYHLLLFIF